MHGRRRQREPSPARARRGGLHLTARRGCVQRVLAQHLSLPLSLLEPGSLPRGGWESGCGSSDARASLRAALEMRRPQWEEVEEAAKLPRPSYGHTICVSEGEPSCPAQDGGPSLLGMVG